MGTLTGFSTSIGFVVASAVGLPSILGNDEYWHWAYFLGWFFLNFILKFFLESIPSIFFVFVLLIFLFDSPFYSIKKGRIEEARKCLKFYHCSDENVETRIKELSIENSALFNNSCSKASAKNRGIVQLLISS